MRLVPSKQRPTPTRAGPRASNTSGEPWAQVRIGAAISHLLRRDLDGAAEELAPVLDMPPDFRIATVTGWLADLDAQLARGPHAGSPATAALRRQIRDFTAAALPSVTKETG